MARVPIWVFKYDPQRFLWLCGNVHGELRNVCDEAIDAYFEPRTPLRIGSYTDHRFLMGITWPMKYLDVRLDHLVFFDWHISLWCKFVPEFTTWVWQGEEYVEQLDPVKCKEYMDAKSKLDERTHAIRPQAD